MIVDFFIKSVQIFLKEDKLQYRRAKMQSSRQTFSNFSSLFLIFPNGIKKNYLMIQFSHIGLMLSKKVSVMNFYEIRRALRAFSFF